MAFVPVPPPPPPKFRENKRAVLVNSGLNTKEMGEGKKKITEASKLLDFPFIPSYSGLCLLLGTLGEKNIPGAKSNVFVGTAPKITAAAAPGLEWQRLLLPCGSSWGYSLLLLGAQEKHFWEEGFG